MMRFEQVQKWVEASSAELKDAALSQVGTEAGAMTASEARSVFAIRRDSSRRAGLEIAGFDALLEELARLPAMDRVLIFSFSGDTYIVSAFVDEHRETLLGCLRIPR